MVGKAYSATVFGVQAGLVEVEADYSGGIPSFDLTGNLGGIVKESRNRVRTAMKNSGIRLNPARITVNFAPAHMRKEGPQFDLAVAIAVLTAAGVVTKEQSEGIFFAGELALDGSLNKINAVLPMVLCAANEGFEACMVPKANEGEASFASGVRIYGVSSLRQCVGFLKGEETLSEAVQTEFKPDSDYGGDFGDIRGQRALKRGLMIAAAGMHNTLISGPPGEGKTMAAQRIPSILPRLTLEESMRISGVYSIAGMLSEHEAYIRRRPFRHPHHTITTSAMTGGGMCPIPGEMSLADTGVLYLDELNLFSRQVLDAIREPLESRQVILNRQRGNLEYPADFFFLASLNPCKCGYYPDKSMCSCTESEVREYQGRIPKPFLDRMDLSIRVDRVTHGELVQETVEMDSLAMRQMVEQAWAIQKKRYGAFDFSWNSRIPAAVMEQFCPMEPAAKSFLGQIFERYQLSARGYYKLIKVARTVADLEGRALILQSDISEAFGFRQM